MGGGVLLSLPTFAQTITGSGTANYLPKFTGATTLGNSIISQGSATNSNQNLVGIGTNNPRATLEIVKQCGANNLAGLLMEYNTFSGACNPGESLGSDYIIVWQFNPWGNVYQHYFYINGTGRVAIGTNTATTQLDVHALSSNDPFQATDINSNVLFKVTASGNVGIGTASPAGPLEVYSSGTRRLYLNSTGNLGVGNINPSYRLDVDCQQSGAAQPPFRLVNYIGHTNMIVDNDDHVGINVTTPATYGGSLVVGAIGTGTNALDLVSTASSGWSNIIRFDNAGGPRHIIADDRSNGWLLIDPGYGGGAANKLKVDGDQDLTGNLAVSGTGEFTGKVSIGSLTPSGTYSSYMLSVDGDIVAKKVIVQTSSWADEVFRNNYKLMPLAELDKYITTHNHLPEIPTEHEVRKHGIDVGEMNRLLLKKVEELSLYVIGMKQQIDELMKIQKP